MQKKVSILWRSLFQGGCCVQRAATAAHMCLVLARPGAAGRIGAPLRDESDPGRPDAHCASRSTPLVSARAAHDVAMAQRCAAQPRACSRAHTRSSYCRSRNMQAPAHTKLHSPAYACCTLSVTCARVRSSSWSTCACRRAQHRACTCARTQWVLMPTQSTQRSRIHLTAAGPARFALPARLC